MYHKRSTHWVLPTYFFSDMSSNEASNGHIEVAQSSSWGNVGAWRESRMPTSSGFSCRTSVTESTRLFNAVQKALKCVLGLPRKAASITSGPALVAYIPVKRILHVHVRCSWNLTSQIVSEATKGDGGSVLCGCHPLKDPTDFSVILFPNEGFLLQWVRPRIGLPLTGLV